MTGIVSALSDVCIELRNVLLKHYAVCGSDVTMLGGGTSTSVNIHADCHYYGSWNGDSTETLTL